jgi:opacity protein-like surface antigen
MRRIFPLVVLILIFSIGAAAQGQAGAGANGRSSPFPASAPSLDPPQWQLALGYQYNRINLTGSPFNTNGLNGSIARYFGNWFGLEAQVGTGFGNTGSTTSPANLSVKSVFAGTGPRLAYRGHWRIEPWIHGTVGVEHLSFGQTVGLFGSNTAFAWTVGGGVDIPLSARTAFRGEADVLETRFFSVNQRNFQALAGLVVNF